MKRIILFLLLMLIMVPQAEAGKEIEISREFTLFTSSQAAGYLKPLFTTIGESFNSGLFTNADYKPLWSVALDFTATGMMVPNSQKTYNAELPDLYGQSQYVLTARKNESGYFYNESGFISQPTIYGGASNAVFAAPQNHFAPDSFYKSVAFVEGNNINFMSGLPSLQLVVGLPTRSQLRFRFLMLPMQDANLTYFTLALNQNIDKLFDLFSDTTLALAANFAYHSLSRNPGIEIGSFAAGLHFSKYWTKNFSATLGFQYESFGGSFNAVKDVKNTNDIVNSPYPEIRNSAPFKFDIESFTNFRIGGGLAYKIGFFELNGFAYYASQPVLGFGTTFYLFQQKEPVPVVIPEPEPEPEPVPIVEPVLIIAQETHVPEADVVIPQVVVKKLSGNVDAFSVENGVEKPLVTINMEEKISRHVSPLLPMVFFDDNSAEIPTRYRKITADSAKRIVKSDIESGNALDVYYEIMNIIGKRMIEHDEAIITLTGTNTGIGPERQNTKLSRERAENVKNYLVDVWGIEPARIKVNARNLPVKASNSREKDGIEENRRVEIASNTWEIIAPSVIHDTARMVLPANIRFKQNAEAEAGLTDWKLYVASNTRKVKEVVGKNELTNVIDWEVGEDELIKAMIRNNLQFNLSLVDTEGKTFISEVHTLPVQLKTIHRDNAAVGDTIRNLYDLILFDFDKSTLSGDNQKIIKMIKDELPEHAIVKVIGYTDRMGNDEYNQKLSLSRAKTAANALGRPNAEIIGSGESVLLYNNDLPEGRFYSRTVIVEVKIPVK